MKISSVNNIQQKGSQKTSFGAFQTDSKNVLEVANEALGSCRSISEITALPGLETRQTGKISLGHILSPSTREYFKKFKNVFLVPNEISEIFSKYTQSGELLEKHLNNLITQRKIISASEKYDKAIFFLKQQEAFLTDLKSILAEDFR